MSNIKRSQENRSKLLDINFTPYFSNNSRDTFHTFEAESMAIMKTKWAP